MKLVSPGVAVSPWVALTAILAAVSLDTGAVGQCPNEGRTKIEKAGISAETTRNCATFSVSVLGFTFSTPGSCRDSYVQRLDDEFACQGARSTANCCRLTGKARINIFGPTNTCPQPPAVMPTTVREAAAIVACSEPVLQRKTFNWSAQEHACASTPQCSKTSATQSGQLAHMEVSGHYMGFWGNPDSQLPPADPAVLAGWMTPFEDVHPNELPQVMRNLWTAVPPVPFAQGIVAEVSISNRLADGTQAIFSFALRGSAAADGRFSFSSSSNYEGPSGETAELETDVSYDQRALYLGSVGEDYYGAYPRSLDGFLPLLLSSACEVMPIIDWMKGPLWIPRTSAAHFASDPANFTVDGSTYNGVRVTEYYSPGSGLLGSRTYELDVHLGLPRVHRIQARDEVGNVLITRTFSDHRPFGEGQLRPFAMTTTTWLAPGSTTILREEKLKISEARRCAETDIKVWRRSSKVDKWYLFR